jgi:hypothetical protein
MITHAPLRRIIIGDVFTSLSTMKLLVRDKTLRSTLLGVMLLENVEF